MKHKMTLLCSNVIFGYTTSLYLVMALKCLCICNNKKYFEILDLVVCILDFMFVVVQTQVHGGNVWDKIQGLWIYGKEQRKVMHKIWEYVCNINTTDVIR